MLDLIWKNLPAHAASNDNEAQRERFEETYGVKVGRLMWRIARRRAQGAAHLSASVLERLGLRSAQDLPHEDCVSREEGPSDTNSANDDMCALKSQTPQTVSEFLNLLARELEQDKDPTDDP